MLQNNSMLWNIATKSGLVGVVVVLTLFFSACGSEPGAGPLAPATAHAEAAQQEVFVPTVTVESSLQEPDEEATPVPLPNLNLTLTPVIQGLQSPTYITHAGDGSGRLFILEQPGAIRIWENGQLLTTPFLDISERVGSANSEQGLLGIAFDPQYAETGLFYIDYTDLKGDTVVSRFSVSDTDPTVADKSSEVQILNIAQPASNHNGGMITFGPDGYLYIGTGDGGASYDKYNNGQDPTTLLGAMLRIDVTSDTDTDYGIPADNPWVDAQLNGQDVRDEIWAIGLRNPWRYSFDRATGDLWIADVGQNQYEEVNFTPAASDGGLNYGWPIQEASHCLQDGCDTSGLVQPVLEYANSGGNCSVTGGYVYRGQNYPELRGVYLFGDYCSGTIWGARQDASGAWQSVELTQMNGRISSFGQDEAGELYVVDHVGTVRAISEE